MIRILMLLAILMKFWHSGYCQISVEKNIIEVHAGPGLWVLDDFRISDLTTIRTEFG